MDNKIGKTAIYSKALHRGIALSSLALFLFGCATSISPSVNREDAHQDLLNEIDSVIVHFMRRNDIPGLSLAVVQADTVLALRGYGEADREQGISVTPQTVFRACSIAKVFTALEIIRLAEEGVIGLDDPLSGVLPDWPNFRELSDGDALSVRHLLSHRGGIPRNSNFHQESVSLVDALSLHLESLDNTAAVYPPGLRYKYSNIGYNILGRIIEEKRGYSYAFYMTDVVLPAYEMDNSTFFLGTLPADATVATGYVHKKWRYEPIPPYNLDTLASGNLFTTAEDLADFMTLLLKSETDSTVLPISRSALLESYTPQYSDPTDPQPIGLGWMTSKCFLGERLIYHQGGDFDASGIVTIMPESGLGISILTNTGSFESAKLFTLIKEIFALAGAKSIPHAVAGDGSPQKGSPEQVGGRYTAYGELLNIFERRGKLRMKFGPVTLKLHPEGKNELGMVYSAHHWLGDLSYFLPIDLTHLKIIFPISSESQLDTIMVAVSDLSYEICTRYPEITDIPESWKAIEGKYNGCTVVIDDGTLKMDHTGYLIESGTNTFMVQGGIFDGETVRYDPVSDSLFHQGIEYRRL